MACAFLLLPQDNSLCSTHLPLANVCPPAGQFINHQASGSIENEGCAHRQQLGFIHRTSQRPCKTTGTRYFRAFPAGTIYTTPFGPIFRLFPSVSPATGVFFSLHHAPTSSYLPLPTTYHLRPHNKPAAPPKVCQLQPTSNATRVSGAFSHRIASHRITVAFQLNSTIQLPSKNWRISLVASDLCHGQLSSQLRQAPPPPLGRHVRSSTTRRHLLVFALLHLGRVAFPAFGLVELHRCFASAPLVFRYLRVA